MKILEQIVEKVKIKVEQQKKALPLRQLQKTKSIKQEPDRFKKAVSKTGIQIIAEIKQASPSAGKISENFDALAIAADYVSAGVAAISILTEEDFFHGSLEILQAVRALVSLPLLRKDFIVDPYQIYQAKYFAADCILLIAGILSEKELKNFSALTKKLNLNALIEIHDESELEKALAVDADIIGINNRNLRTFKVDLRTSLKLKEKIPRNKIVISESGIKDREQVKELEKAGFDAILIGESLLRADDKKEKIRLLLGGRT